MKFEDAIKDYRDAFSKAKTSGEPPKLMFKIRFQLGKTLRRVAGDQKKYTLEKKKEFLEESIEELKTATTLTSASSSDLAAVFNNLGLSFFENDQFAEAVAQYT